MTSRPAGSLGAAPFIDEAGYSRLTRGIHELLGMDLAGYRPAQMWRRVNAFATTRGLRNADALIAACRTQPRLLAELRDMLTINVSEFFRDPDAWKRLTTRLGRQMSADRGFRAWSAGCSTGLEPYSIAMLAAELAPAGNVQILATDIDQTALQVARAARYDAATVGGLSAERRRRFFSVEGSDSVLKPHLRAMITFRQHDLLSAPASPRTFDLVVCRNVVIYFTEAAKATVHKRLADAIRPGGILFVGTTETILSPGQFGLAADGPGLYSRIG